MSGQRLTANRYALTEATQEESLAARPRGGWRVRLFSTLTLKNGNMRHMLLNCFTISALRAQSRVACGGQSIFCNRPATCVFRPFRDMVRNLLSHSRLQREIPAIRFPHIQALLLLRLTSEYRAYSARGSGDARPAEESEDTGTPRPASRGRVCRYEAIARFRRALSPVGFAPGGRSEERVYEVLSARLGCGSVVSEGLARRGCGARQWRVYALPRGWRVRSQWHRVSHGVCA